MDVFSTVAAVIGLCSTLVQCIGKFVSQVGAHEVVNSLRKDLQELFRELELLHAELPRDVRLEHQIEEGVMEVSHDCQNELSKLRFIIPEESSNRIWRTIKNEFMLKAQNGEVLHVQQRIARYQHSIHFYMTLVKA